MSFRITVEVLGANQSELKSIVPNLPKAGSLALRPYRDGLMFWKTKGFEVDGAEEALADHATGKSDFWPLKQEAQKNLSELLQAFFKICPRHLILFAAEAGDLPKRESQIKFSEFLELVADGHLANKVSYHLVP